MNTFLIQPVSDRMFLIYKVYEETEENFHAVAVGYREKNNPLVSRLRDSARVVLWIKSFGDKEFIQDGNRFVTRKEHLRYQNMAR